MSSVPEINPLSERRMESFVGSGDGAMMAGKRRTGQVRLMEDLHRYLKENLPGSNIFTVKEGDEIENILPDSLPGNSIVLIHFVSKNPHWEKSVRNRAISTVTVYWGQELCHQVPVCFKNTVEIED